MTNYENTIRALFAIFEQANIADSEHAEGWQRKKDAHDGDNALGYLCQAIVALAGEAILDHWWNTNEVEFSLANRS